MKARIPFRTLIIISIIFLPGLASAVDITFSEPVIIDSSQQVPIPAGRFLEAPGDIGVTKVFPGPSYDLVMSWGGGGYNLIRLDFDGNLVDSFPNYVSNFVTKYPMPNPDDTIGYSVNTVTWADPYWYFLLARNDKLYYSRATSELELIDVPPVELMPQPAQVITDGGYIWIIRQDDGTGKYYVDRYHLPDLTPQFTEVEVPDYYIDHGQNTARNGLFFISNDNPLTRFSAAYLSPDGVFLEFDTLAYTPSGRGTDIRINPWNTDSALCVWLEHSDTTINRIGYFFITASGNPNPPQANTVSLGHTPDNYFPRLRDLALSDSAVYLFLRLSSSADSTIMVQLDPVNDTLVSDDYIPRTSPIFGSSSNLRIHTSKGIYTIDTGSDLVAGSFELQPPFAGEMPKPILFHTVSQTRPTLIADSEGLLVYAELAGDSSLDIHGYYIPYAAYPHVSEDFDVITDDTLHFLPWLDALNGQKALFWENYEDPIHFHGRFVLFDGLRPSPKRLADHTTELRSANFAHRPTFCQVDSMLYIDHYYDADYVNNWVLCLYSRIYAYDMKNDLLLPNSFFKYSVGSNSLMPVGDSLVVAIPYRECVQQSPAYCWQYECSYQGMAIFNDSLMGSFLYAGSPTDCSGWVGTGGDLYIDLDVANIGGETIVSFENSMELKKLDYPTRSWQTVVDILSASEVGIGGTLARYHIYPVETDQAIAVFLIDGSRYLRNRLLVFTKDWEYLGQTLMPTIGSVKDFSQFQYSPENNTIYFAYSAYFGKPFSSYRVVLQSVKLDNLTDTDDNGAIAPSVFSLHQNSPNPFNASTKIEFYLPRQSCVTLAIYNILGQKIATLINGNLPAGNHEIIWDGRDGRGNSVATGVYLYKIAAEGKEITRKMMLLK